MLDISNFDHIGIRISDRDTSVAFYQLLGFKLVADGGFSEGHPLVMLHPSGLNINLLGPATAKAGENVLMDGQEKFPGITTSCSEGARCRVDESLRHRKRHCNYGQS